MEPKRLLVTLTLVSVALASLAGSGTFSRVASAAGAAGRPTSTPTSTPFPFPTAAVSPTLGLAPSSAAAGPTASVTVRGGGFVPGETVSVSYIAYLASGGTALEQVMALAGPDGTFIQRYLPVPANVLPGTYPVVAQGQRSGRLARASLTVLPGNPTPTSTATPTATAAPTAAATSTPIPTPGAVPAPAIVIDKVLILHAVSGRRVSTRTLRLAERADFYVLYHTVAAGTLKPSASLSITRNGKTLMHPGLASLILGHHPAFGAHLTFPRAALGTLYAHFRVTLGSASARRDRRFSVRA